MVTRRTSVWGCVSVWHFWTFRRRPAYKRAVDAEHKWLYKASVYSIFVGREVENAVLDVLGEKGNVLRNIWDEREVACACAECLMMAE